jgi:hypothetical protein
MVSWNSFTFKKIIGPDLIELPEYVHRFEDGYIYEEDPGKGGLPNLDWLTKHICSCAPNSVFLGMMNSYSSKSMDTSYANVIFSKDGWWMFNSVCPMTPAEAFCDKDGIIRGTKLDGQRAYFDKRDIDRWDNTKRMAGYQL